MRDNAISSKDADGNELKENDFVSVLEIPDWLVQDMEVESRIAVEGCKDKVMQIYEIDSYGYAWLETVSVETDTEYMTNKFCIEPFRLRKNENT